MVVPNVSLALVLVRPVETAIMHHKTNQGNVHHGLAPQLPSKTVITIRVVVVTKNAVPSVVADFVKTRARLLATGTAYPALNVK